jgi:hypothetical protein
VAKESLDFVNGVREKVEELGYERKVYFTRVRPTYVCEWKSDDQR